MDQDEGEGIFRILFCFISDPGNIYGSSLINLNDVATRVSNIGAPSHITPTLLSQTPETNLAQKIVTLRIKMTVKEYSEYCFELYQTLAISKVHH